MLEINLLRKEKERVLTGLRKRNFKSDELEIIDRILEKDDNRKYLKTNLDKIRADLNKKSKDIGVLFKQGDPKSAGDLRESVNIMKGEIKRLEESLRLVENDIEIALLNVPNIPHELVRAGKGDQDNEIYKDWQAQIPDPGNDALPHWELAEKFGMIDFKLGAKITGSGFTLFRNGGALIQRSLINFFLDEARRAGYEEIGPPLLVNSDSARATGQLPDKEGQMYFIEKDDLYLIPTSEVPLTNMFRETILKKSDLPIKLTAYSPCFRREAGSYGSDVKGLNRVHQFDKVEIVRIEDPAVSYKALDEMLDHIEQLLVKLELPYRILRLCGGDLGFTAALTYDFEVFAAAQKKWLEVSSVSNFETFQSNRMDLRLRDGKQKTVLPHTLNGSALALARIIAALMENNQSAEGIRIPNALQPYTGLEIIN